MDVDVMAAEIEQTLCRVLTGAQDPWELSPARLDELWAEAETTRGVELLARVLAAEDRKIKSTARERADACLRDAAVSEMLRHRVLRRIVDAADAAGTRMLFIKGAGLAYTVYPEPYLRPACDIDLFITRETLDGAEAALAAAGFVRALEPDVESASMQRHYTWRDGYGIDYFVDLHWSIANRHVFAQALSFSDAWNASQPIARLGRSARTLGTPDALLLACIHRIAHHKDDPDRLWLWDIHLLTGTMTAADADVLAARAARSGMRAVVARGLELAQARFGTAVAPGLLEELRRPDAATLAAPFFGRNARQVDFVISDLAALPSAGDRVRLIREHLFPGLGYMRARYPACPRALLPFAYIYRIARGAQNWFLRFR
jgi:hypothetical protein